MYVSGATAVVLIILTRKEYVEKIIEWKWSQEVD
jgi:hypothetical protein